MKLNVFFGNEIAGSLESTADRGVVFCYDNAYLENKNAVPLSASLPLQKEEFSQKQCIPFFRGFCRKRIPERKSPTTFTFQKQVHSSCLKHWTENVRIGTVL